MSSDAAILEGMGEYQYGFNDPENLRLQVASGA